MNNEQHAQLTRIGKATPMGDFMRSYWQPVALSSQVVADGAPLLTWLLGQRLVVFRDTEGKVGVLDDHCLHRGVSLSFGRNEECGLRCLYHGWKFAVDGRVMETPNHDNAVYRERKRAKAYPLREQSGLIWTYIGPADQEPPFRAFDFDAVPDAHRTVFRANSDASYLALWEGGVDSSHVGMLHTNDTRPTWAAKRNGQAVESSAWDSLAPSYEIGDTDYGYRYVAFRAIPGRDDARHARAVPAILPNIRIIPGHLDFAIAIIEVPMTDTRTATYQIAYSHGAPVDRAWMRRFLGFNGDRYNEQTCEVTMQWPSDMGQDRAAMDKSWTGFAAIEFEDVAMAMSLADPEWDHAEENLVAADIAVMRLRQMLLNALKKFECGTLPQGRDLADVTHARSYDRVVLNIEDWKAL
jgi:phthalate 4,5-dioxygenase oxygenase subunit